MDISSSFYMTIMNDGPCQKPPMLFELPSAHHKRSSSPSLNTHQLLRTAATALTMPRLMPVLMLIFLILLFETFSSQVQSIDDGIKPGYLMSKCTNVQMHARKALEEITLDYDYGGPNPKHDPRKGKPGNGGKNP